MSPFSNEKSGRRPTTASRAVRSTLESLEGRELLSHASALHAQASLPAGFIAPPVVHSPGPIVGEQGVGYAVKSPRFYPYYLGPKLTQLNAAGLKAQVIGDNLILTGIVVANDIPQTSDSPATDAFYVFGINRGGATGAGPIVGRPKIVFDAVVQVAVNRSGVTATVSDVATGATVTLPAESVLFKQNAVQVTVPGTLAPAGSDPSRYTVNFFTASGALSGPQSVASIAPEFRNIPVAFNGFARPLFAAGRHARRG